MIEKLKSTKPKTNLVHAILGDADSVDMTVVNDYKGSVLRPLLDAYSPENTFNLDEFALFYRALPNTTMSLKGERCTDGKQSKIRVSVLAGANQAGTEKLPLLVIGKYGRPRCFKNAVSLPTKYKHNSKAWMTSLLFEAEMLEWDEKLRAEDRSILVVVDNCSAHPKDLCSKLKNINLQFLPPNCTSVLQPLDMGIIKNVKHIYRSLLIKFVEAEGREGVGKVELIDAMRLLAESWALVEVQTIQRCFSKAGWAEIEYEDYEYLEEPISDAMREYFEFDDEVATSGSMDDSTILEIVRHEAEEDPEFDDDFDDCLENSGEQNKSALDILNDLEDRLMSEETSPEIFQSLYKLKSSIKN
jgi:hypothetical protein